MSKNNIVIAGAGLVGSLLSIYLSRRGHKIDIYERRNDMRKGKAEAGRSINLALSDRGIKALREVGIMDEIEKICIPMHGRHIHKPDGSTAFQPYGREGQFINSVSRADLNAKLMDMAESHGVDIHFDHRCEKLDFAGKTASFMHGSVEVNKKFDVLFGSDGAYSSARLQHMLQHEKFEYEQKYIDFGYKELHISPATDGGFQLDKNALHIWPRGNYMLIALPNIDGSFTCTLFFPFTGDPSFESLDTKEKVNTFFKSTFGDAFEKMPTLEKDFFQNPTTSLVTVKCFPWTRKGSFALIGDAAHAIVPFFGQGMNCGFEDCSVLNTLIDTEEDWNIILEKFQRSRKPDADAIADLALNNFVEMRDRVGDEKFLLQKKIEASFSAKHPDKWIPAYSQVTFSPGIRYSEALTSSRRQESIMQEVMKLPSIENLWDSKEVESLILKKLTETNVPIHVFHRRG